MEEIFAKRNLQKKLLFFHPQVCQLCCICDTTVNADQKMEPVHVTETKLYKFLVGV